MLLYTLYILYKGTLSPPQYRRLRNAFRYVACSQAKPDVQRSLSI